MEAETGGKKNYAWHLLALVFYESTVLIRKCWQVQRVGVTHHFFPPVSVSMTSLQKSRDICLRPPWQPKNTASEACLFRHSIRNSDTYTVLFFNLQSFFYFGSIDWNDISVKDVIRSLLRKGKEKVSDLSKLISGKPGFLIQRVFQSKLRSKGFEVSTLRTFKHCSYFK